MHENLTLRAIRLQKEKCFGFLPAATGMNWPVSSLYQKPLVRWISPYHIIPMIKLKAVSLHLLDFSCIMNYFAWYGSAKSYAIHVFLPESCSKKPSAMSTPQSCYFIIPYKIIKISHFIDGRQNYIWEENRTAV